MVSPTWFRDPHHMTANTPLILAVLAAILGPMITYITAIRKLSGKVETSEAQSLWDESASIREDYRTRISDSEKRQAHLEERIGKLEEKNNRLQSENLDLKKANMELALDLAQIKERCDGLERENEHLRTTIRRMGGLTDAG